MSRAPLPERARIFFDIRAFSAREVLFAASLAEGTTTIVNAAASLV